MKIKVKIRDKREFDIAIINPEDNIEMAKLLNPVVKEFKIKNKLCQSNRGFCFRHSEDFKTWVEKTYPVLFRNIKNKLIVVEGLFQIDYPEMLPLDESDLYAEEWEHFLDNYEDDYHLSNGNKKAISELIWTWANKNLERLDDFYYMNHGWVEIDGLIIDFTWLQFRHAINNKIPVKERYEYL